MNYNVSNSNHKNCIYPKTFLLSIPKENRITERTLLMKSCSKDPLYCSYWGNLMTQHVLCLDHNLARREFTKTYLDANLIDLCLSQDRTCFNLKTKI
ncbi:unnamed protein product [Moneuplotes crassus]|uniref:Uncharacterized protein n=1 Tax=Euplotes crassus TaxID=5936 RepID=A0AAD1Y2Q5_EUPCR|nr:unnamed protein product [Moneuplotes crassus]